MRSARELLTMNQWSLRRWPRLLLLFAVICGVAHALKYHDPLVGELHDVEPPVAPGNADDGSRQIAEEHPIPGAAAVDEALSLLRRVQPSPAERYHSYRRPSGVLATTTYYAKELFFLLFMNGPPQHDLLTSHDYERPPKLEQPLHDAVKLLSEAAAENNPDALYILADMNFYGNYSHPKNYGEAFRRYEQLAELNGNSSAQHMVGFMYATGIGGAVEMDQAKAMLYYTFAAEGGDIRSQMTVAYRHHEGISTPRECGNAVFYYRQVADRAIAYKRSGPPGGHPMYKEAVRIADELGGVYGEGASHSSSGPNARQSGPSSDAYAAFEDFLEYLDLMHRKGDLKATFSLAKLHYDGTRVLEQDYGVAKQKFLEVARKYWNKDGSRTDVPPATAKLAAKAAGYLGRMFLRGEGMEQSFQIAKTWFKRGVEHGDSLSQYSLGLMYLHGLGVPRDPVLAAEYLAPAADQDQASAQVLLGALFLDQGDVSTAIRYFETAARQGHIEAFYYLAELSDQGIGKERSCGIAAAYYKIVAEKAEPIVSSFIEANEAYEAGDIELALVDWMMAAEQGFEIGQANVAFLLDQNAQPRWSISLLFSFLVDALKLSWSSSKRATTGLVNDASLALIYWTRSAKQQNIDSMVKMGDYYLSGLGVPGNSSGKLNEEKAAACYTAAAETMQSAQAMWNLGWMHENGVGAEQDFHLAKRFYDQAFETNSEAYLPVTLALLKLRARSAWNTLTHGRVKSIQNEPSPKRPRTLTEWISDFLKNDAAMYAQDYDDVDGTVEDPYEPDDWDPHHPHGHHPRNAGDDYYGDDEGIPDDSIIESLVIVALATALAALLYYRQLRQLEHRRRARDAQEGADAEGQEEDRGVFPRLDDPEWNNWVAGGIGH
ncbi:hypothetical protein BDY21DRAFT_342020 [Lineolata rhizophorae]|uniref:Ubiquitin-protein ligase Sel1/Ubx2 n=1 Tax=Lineolata rhizophorae TaxID=578093 RepID=A0A6A6P308_9PEZI|nr:hypothetical protein BDY21DRAFT_342020 [Lineolata rhizophorae]